MFLRYEFDREKSFEAMCYIVQRLGSVDKVMLTKLMYIAERDHMIRHGRPLSGDVLKAMQFGPVPSGALDLLNWGSLLDVPVTEYLQIVGYDISLKRHLQYKRLGPSERDVLHDVIRTYGHKEKWQLVEETHNFSEYRAVWKGDGAEVIPYELILEQYAPQEKRVMGRPLLAATALSSLDTPFEELEPDL